MILTPELIKLRLKKLGVRTDKYLGQHFLIDQAVLDDIMQESQKIVSPQDAIVEAGPGLGVLTSELIKLSNPVIAIEKDPVFADRLKEFTDNPDNLTVIKGDILDILGLASHPIPNSRFRIPSPWVFIANIPYAITSPLLRKLVYRDNPPHHILVLVQKEAAQRIVAKPGDRHRGLLTVQLEIMAESEIIHFVPSTTFWPAPEVESALLLMKLRPEPLIEKEIVKDVLRVVIAGFSSKRKQLLNSLSGGLALPAQSVRSLLEKANIDPTRRAETLTLEEWQNLTVILSETKNLL